MDHQAAETSGNATTTETSQSKKTSKKPRQKSIPIEMDFSLTPRGLVRSYDDRVVNGISIAGYGLPPQNPELVAASMAQIQGPINENLPPIVDDPTEFPAPTVDWQTRASRLLMELAPLLREFASTCDKWVSLDALTLFIREEDRLSDKAIAEYDEFFFEKDQMVQLLDESNIVAVKEEEDGALMVNSIKNAKAEQAIQAILHSTNVAKSNNPVDVAENQRQQRQLNEALEELTLVRADYQSLVDSNRHASEKQAQEMNDLRRRLVEQQTKQTAMETAFREQLQRIEAELTRERQQRSQMERLNATDISLLKRRLINAQTDLLRLRAEQHRRLADEQMRRAQSVMEKAKEMINVFGDQRQMSKTDAKMVDEWLKILIDATQAIKPYEDWMRKFEYNSQLAQLTAGSLDYNDLEPFVVEMQYTPRKSAPSPFSSHTMERLSSPSPPASIASVRTSGFPAPPLNVNDVVPQASGGFTGSGGAIGAVANQPSSLPVQVKDKEEKLFAHVRKTCPEMTKEEFKELFMRCKNSAQKLSEVAKMMCELYQQERY